MYQQRTALESTVEKGEIAHNEKFLLFRQCFLFNQITESPFVIFLTSYLGPNSRRNSRVDIQKAVN